MSFFVKVIGIVEEKRREVFLFFDDVEEREWMGFEVREIRVKFYSSSFFEKWGKIFI